MRIPVYAIQIDVALIENHRLLNRVMKYQIKQSFNINTTKGKPNNTTKFSFNIRFEVELYVSCICQYFSVLPAIFLL